MLKINIMDDNFVDLIKYNAIGSLDQAKAGAVVKLKQIKGAKYFFICDFTGQNHKVIFDSSKGGVL